MSIITSIFLFLLCLISLHACNARRLADMNKDPEKKIHLSSKDFVQNNEKDSHSLPNKHEVAEKHKEIRVDDEDNIEKQKMDSKAVRNKMIKGQRVVQTESLVSVAWRVPHKKKGETQPGFNLDYSPPKTHPPVHN